MWIAGTDKHDQPQLVNLDHVSCIYGHSAGVVLVFSETLSLELAEVAGLTSWRALDHLAELVGAPKPEVDLPWTERRKRRRAQRRMTESQEVRVSADSAFYFNDTATTEIYTLSLHDALPISACGTPRRDRTAGAPQRSRAGDPHGRAAEHRSEEHTSELQSRRDLVCRLL